MSASWPYFLILRVHKALRTEPTKGLVKLVGSGLPNYTRPPSPERFGFTKTEYGIISRVAVEEDSLASTVEEDKKPEVENEAEVENVAEVDNKSELEAPKEVAEVYAPKEVTKLQAPKEVTEEKSPKEVIS